MHANSWLAFSAMAALVACSDAAAPPSRTFPADAEADAPADAPGDSLTGEAPIDCDAAPKNAPSTAPVCGDWTLGVGTACDVCVNANCSAPGDECCHRAQLCSDPTYEYRVALSRCIADNCAGPCFVACEGWPLSPQ